MKFHVNADCIGCGLCVSTCPEVFTDFKAKTTCCAAHTRLLYMHAARIEAVTTEVSVAQLCLWFNVCTI